MFNRPEFLIFEAGYLPGLHYAGCVQAAIFKLLEQEIQLAFSFCNVLKPEIGVWPRQAIRGFDDDENSSK